MTVAQLRELLYALSMVASNLTIYEPSTPEIRIKTERDAFVVRTRYRRLCFVGWESILRGEDHSVAYILSTITGTAGSPRLAAPRIERPSAVSSSGSSASPMPAGGVPRWAKIAVMAVLILGINATTAWMLLRPAPSPLPQHEVLAESDSRALLAKAAGEYETGTAEGSRRLIIDANGTLRLAKYGPLKAILDERTKPIRGAMVNGHAAPHHHGRRAVDQGCGHRHPLRRHLQAPQPLGALLEEPASPCGPCLVGGGAISPGFVGRISHASRG